MRKQIVTVALAGSLGLGGAALLTPGLAVAQEGSTSSSNSVADRISRIKDALAGLVTDKTLTQAQADKVATTLAEKMPAGRGGFGRGPGAGRVSPETVAGILGITVEELRTQSGAGQTLAEIAASKGISKDTLIDKLVAGARTQLAADVKAGTITQAQADEIASGLEARITEKVDRVGFGKRGHHRHSGDAPSTSMATPAPSASSSSA